MKKTFLTFSLFAAGVLSLNAAHFFVATSGNDANPGSAEKPFATFEKAQAAVRAARVAQPKESSTVTFAAGIYPLSQKLTFTPADSGVSEESPICYRAAEGAEVILSGGTVLKAEWQKEESLPGVWKTKIDLNGAPRFEQLWVDGKRVIRARTPNSWSFARLQAISEKDIEGKETKLHTFQVDSDIAEGVGALSKEELADAQIQVFHKWDTTREWLTGVNPQKNILTGEGPKMAGHNSMARGSLYYVENFKQALDAPGEWFLDREGWLYYYPLEGQELSSVEVVYPRLEHLLEFAGESGEKVKFIEFDGIKFRHSEYRVPAGGVPPWQAAMVCQDATVLLNNADYINFVDCAIEHTGNTAFWAKANCKHCKVDTTRIFDVGAAGVRIGETANHPEKERTGFITINNCIIQSGGRIHPSAVGVWLGHTSDNRVTQNEISDFLYTGVSVGWCWGYGESGSQRNLIAYNHIHHLGYKILSDMGGIYTLGNSVGTVLRGNHIHDVYSSAYGGWGLYPDEGTTGMLLDDNLVYNTKDGGFHQHYGRENTVRNNIFAFSDEGQIAVTRKEEHTSFIFENNIVIFDQGKLLGYGGWAAGANVKMNHNLFWNTAGKPIDFAGKTFEEWKAAGHDKDSLIEDPLFVDPAKRDFHFKKGSPVEKIGFKPFDYTQAGVQGSPQWIALAQSLKYPGFGEVRSEAPLKVSEDFEDPASSTFMGITSFNVEGRKELAVRTDKFAASGKYSLVTRDMPDLQFDYDPHFCFDPNYTAGTLHMSYRIRLEPGVVAHNEIRSEGNPYLVGPSLFFRKGALDVQGQKLLDLPSDEWLGVELSAPLGEKASGKWSLVLTLPDGARKEFNDLPCNPKWNRARWLGFCALEKTSAAFYLDDFNLELLPAK